MASGSAEPSCVGLFIGVATEDGVIMHCLLMGEESLIAMSNIAGIHGLRTL